MSLALGDMSVTMLLQGMPDRVLPMFSSRTFMVLQRMCESFIHLQFISVYGVSCWLSPFLFFLSFIFFFFTYLSRSPNTICWRGCFCSILRSCLLRHMLIDRKGLSLFLGSLFCSIGLCACFYAGTGLFGSQWPCNTVWPQVLWSLLLCSAFSTLLQLFGVVYGSI